MGEPAGETVELHAGVGTFWLEVGADGYALKTDTGREAVVPVFLFEV